MCIYIYISYRVMVQSHVKLWWPERITYYIRLFWQRCKDIQNPDSIRPADSVRFTKFTWIQHAEVLRIGSSPASLSCQTCQRSPKECQSQASLTEPALSISLHLCTSLSISLPFVSDQVAGSVGLSSLRMFFRRTTCSLAAAADSENFKTNAGQCRCQMHFIFCTLSDEIGDAIL